MEVTQGAPFESFGLSEATMRAIRNKHYTVSTPVQAGCIPPMLEWRDVVAKAPTGTGKTFAYGIPVGSNPEFADDATLNRAIEGRTEM